MGLAIAAPHFSLLVTMGDKGSGHSKALPRYGRGYFVAKKLPSHMFIFMRQLISFCRIMLISLHNIVALYVGLKA